MSEVDIGCNVARCRPDIGKLMHRWATYIRFTVRMRVAIVICHLLVSRAVKSLFYVKCEKILDNYRFFALFLNCL